MKIKPVTNVTGFTLEISTQEMDTLTLALRNSSRMLQSAVNEDRMMNSTMINGEIVPLPPNDGEFNLRATNTLLLAIDKVRSSLNETK